MVTLLITNLILVDENSYLAKIGAFFKLFPHMGLALFYTVNFSRRLNGAKDIADMSWLVHELMHVVQYRKMGVRYIPRSLWAQIDGGYEYGNVSGRSFVELNLEQQAQLVQDYYLNLKHGSQQAKILLPFVEEMQHYYK